MNDSLITEGIKYDRLHLSYWHRSPHKLGRNHWAWIRPDEPETIEVAMSEPVICHSMDHWAEPKPVEEIGPPFLSLWTIDYTCRELGFKPVFLQIVAGRGCGATLESYGQYQIIFPTENDVFLYSAYESRMVQHDH